MTKKLFTRLFAVALMALTTQISVFSQGRDYLFSLTSAEGHGGDAQWVMKKAGDVTDRPEDLSTTGYKAEGWATAIVPGTVLNSLVNNGVYPEPYYGLNNKITRLERQVRVLENRLNKLESGKPTFLKNNLDDNDNMYML